jgi:hypothetical protein
MNTRVFSQNLPGAVDFAVVTRVGTQLKLRGVIDTSARARSQIRLADGLGVIDIFTFNANPTLREGRVTPMPGPKPHLNTAFITSTKPQSKGV